MNKHYFIFGFLILMSIGSVSASSIFFDGAESGLISDKWVLPYNPCVYDSGFVFAGSFAINCSDAGGNALAKVSLASVVYPLNVTAYYYYTGVSNANWQGLEFGNTAVGSGTGLAVGEFDSVLPSSNFVYFSDTSSFDSGVLKTVGWHKFEFVVSSSSSADLFIDDVFVASVSGSTASNVLDVGTFATSSDAYFDNVSVVDSSVPPPVSCDFCTGSCSPCGGGCTATDLSSMYSSYDFVSDSQGVGDISGWNTSCITNMYNMFSGSNFNQPIGGWDVSHVTAMDSMFSGDSVFNQNLDSWNPSSNTNFAFMFLGTSFNQNLGLWNVTNADTMEDMFGGVTLSSANYDSLLNGWASMPVKSGVNFGAGNSMYSSAGQSARDYLVNVKGWSISDGGLTGVPPPSCSFCTESCSPCGGGCTATDLSSMYWTYNFVVDSQGVGNISGWNTSCITNMNNLFDNSNGFNQDISGWNTSSVTGMNYMFSATSFNQPIGSWDTHNVQSMEGMFISAPFNQDISHWNVSSVTDMLYMFSGVNLSVSNYDSLLNGWAQESLQSSVIVDFGSSQYSSAGQSARDYLVNVKGWSISDGGLFVPPNCESWHPIFGECTNGTFLTSYVQLTPNCSTTVYIPSNNGSLTACVSTGSGRGASGGGVFVASGSKEVVVPQSVLPSAPAPVVSVASQPSVLSLVWDSIVHWFNNLFKGG